MARLAIYVVACQRSFERPRWNHLVRRISWQESASHIHKRGLVGRGWPVADGAARVASWSAEGWLRKWPVEPSIEREADGRWMVPIPKVKGCDTYGRTIDQARDRNRVARQLSVRNAETVTIEDDVRTPAAVKLAVRNARQSRQQLERARGRVSAVGQRAVRLLHQRTKLGHRDAGSILGLSRQRVRQLEKQKEG